MLKKGSHVGFVLSFVVFVIFLAFLYSAIEPVLKVSRDKENLVEIAGENLIKEFKVNLTTTSVKVLNCVESGGSECSCFQIAGEFEKNSVAKKSDGVKVDSYYDSGKLYVKKELNEDFYKIYFSNIFDENLQLTNCKTLQSTEYQMGLTKTEEIVHDEKVLGIKNLYTANYEYLKGELKIPANSEFGFSFINSKGEEEIFTEEKNVGVNIYTKKFLINYINTNAELKQGFVIVRVW